MLALRNKKVHFFMLNKFSVFATVCSALITINHSYSQPSLSPFDLHPPLKGDLALSASFGEIRTNSFHAGLDFRTGGKIGQNVYSSADGFVARVRVGGTGFGKAIYIQHPNGLTTVYAHLDRFTPQIDKLVKDQQYSRKSFEIDLPLNPSQFPVKLGELIGISGNTGSSGGPHLHYEVRLTKNQTPLNPAFSNLALNDILPPVINGAWLYPLNASSSIDGINSTLSLNVQNQHTTYSVADTIRVSGDVALGIKAYDFVNWTSLRCGIYSIKMFVNEELRYHFSMDEFSFSESRYVNSHIDYTIRQEEGKRVHKLYREPNNLLSTYKKVVNNGIIQVKPDSLYRIKVVVEDPKGNSCNLSATIMGVEKSNLLRTVTAPEATLPQQQWLFFKENTYQTDWFDISMPKNSLYSNINFTYDVKEKCQGSYSPVIHIHNRNTAVHRPYTLRIKADSLPNKLADKALIATVNIKDEIESAGGKFSQGLVETQVNYFGDFFVVVDSVAPTISPINIFNRKDMSKEKKIMFRVDDNLSGVATIVGTINGNWALFEYDPKNKMVFYEIDDQRLEKGKTHQLVLIITDRKDNQNSYRCTFTW
jgi:hypothetical protein